jgi:hypothetical protein
MEPPNAAMPGCEANAAIAKTNNVTVKSTKTISTG